MAKLPTGLKHTAWSLLDTISYPVVYFALTPFLIHYMGEVVYGLWIVLGTVTIVLQLFNFNLSYTAMRHIAYERVAGSRETVVAIINSLLKITLIQFGFVIGVGSILALILAHTGWLGDYANHFHHGPLCFFLAAVLGGLKFFEQILQSILKSYENFRGAAILNTTYRVVTLGGTLLITILFPRIIVYVLAGNIIFSILYLAIHYGYICRVIPFYRLAIVNDRGLVRKLLGFSVWPWIQTIIIVLTFQADRFWVSGYAGLKAVSAYGLVATMYNHIHMIFTAMVAWTLPGIIGMYARNEDIETQYNFIRALLTVITIAGLLLFYFLSPLIFTLWLGADTYVHIKPYIQAFTGFELAFVHTIMPLFYLNGTGKERVATYVTILCCTVCYILMLGGLWIFHSPIALVRGMTIGACIAIPFFNIVSRKQVEHKADYWAMVWEVVPVFAAIGLVYATSAILIVILIGVGGWAMWRCYVTQLLKGQLWRQLLNIEGQER